MDRYALARLGRQELVEIALNLQRPSEISSTSFQPRSAGTDLDRVFALARKVTTYSASIRERKRRALEGSLTDLVGTSPAYPVTEGMRRRMARVSPKLLTFPDVAGEADVTNSTWGGALGPSVITPN